MVPPSPPINIISLTTAEGKAGIKCVKRASPWLAPSISTVPNSKQVLSKTRRRKIDDKDAQVFSVKFSALKGKTSALER